MSDTSRHLTYFKVENFKRFESFEMKDLGQFNLIVGDNNVGKTSVLEALLVNLDTKFPLNNLFRTLSFRKLKSSFIYQDIEMFCNQSIIQNESNYAINFEWRDNSLKELRFSINVDKGSQAIQLKKDYHHQGGRPVIQLYPKVNEVNFHESVIFNSSTNFPFIPFYKGHDDDLTKFYSRLQVDRSFKKSFLRSLMTIVPNVEDIELSNPYSDQGPHLIVYKRNIDTSIPLAMFGEGTIKLFRFLAEISINKRERLMIDEVDAGIHYSRFKEFWKVVLTSAKENDVQLFMTTHSKECIQYFVEALSEPGMAEMQKDARAIALVELPDKSVKAFTYPFENLEANLSLGNEVRAGAR